MKVICSYCRVPIGEKEPLDDTTTTHSICKECFEYFSRQWVGFHLSDYLDTFEEPMAFFNPNTRVVAYNNGYAQAFLTGDEKTIGVLCGEFLNCSNSKLAEGCGRTEFCPACGFRNAILKTLRTGLPQEKVPATLKTIEMGKSVEKHFEISTERHGPVVRMKFEKLIMEN